MKYRSLIIPALLLLAVACQRMNLEEPKADVSQEAADTVFFLTVHASRVEPDTKALDLDDGVALHSYWKSSETVKVFRSGIFLGALGVSPEAGETPRKADLAGNITTGSLSVGNALSLLLPRDVWDYTGQSGALTGSNSIEEMYAYALATVNVQSIGGGGSVTTTNAYFANQQSIYRFGFKVGENYIDPKSFTVSATGGRLVRNVSYVAGAWIPTYGTLSVTPSAASADQFYYVSLRNDCTVADTYSFVLTGSEYALYLATKAIPATVLGAPGKFISVKNVSAVKADFGPGGGTISSSENVL